LLCETTWTVRKVALRCTPHHLAYHVGSKAYALSVSSPVAYRDQTNERGLPFIEAKFELRLISASTWQTLDKLRIGSFFFFFFFLFFFSFLCSLSYSFAQICS